MNTQRVEANLSKELSIRYSVRILVMKIFVCSWTKLSNWEVPWRNDFLDGSAMNRWGLKNSGLTKFVESLRISLIGISMKSSFLNKKSFRSFVSSMQSLVQITVWIETGGDSLRVSKIVASKSSNSVAPFLFLTSSDNSVWSSWCFARSSTAFRRDFVVAWNLQREINW